MAVKVGINGFGRIGRNVVRAGLHNPNVDFVAVNDITDTKTLAHLLKYDSVLGQLKETVTAEADGLRIGKKHIKVFAIKDPAELDWTPASTCAGQLKKSSSPLRQKMKTLPSCWA